MIAKRARLREKSYKENVKLALCLTAPMFFILSVGLHCKTFLQKFVNDKINGDHPLRLELGPTTGRCPWLNMAPDFALSCSFTCLLDCPTQCFVLLRVTQDQIHGHFFSPVPDLLSDLVNILSKGFLSWFPRCLHHQIPSCFLVLWLFFLIIPSGFRCFLKIIPKIHSSSCNIFWALDLVS